MAASVRDCAHWSHCVRLVARSLSPLFVSIVHVAISAAAVAPVAAMVWSHSGVIFVAVVWRVLRARVNVLFCFHKNQRFYQ
jgi:hypothetical protein